MNFTHIEESLGLSGSSCNEQSNHLPGQEMSRRTKVCYENRGIAKYVNVYSRCDCGFQCPDWMWQWTVSLLSPFLVTLLPERKDSSLIKHLSMCSIQTFSAVWAVIIAYQVSIVTFSKFLIFSSTSFSLQKYQVFQFFLEYLSWIIWWNVGSAQSFKTLEVTLQET